MADSNLAAALDVGDSADTSPAPSPDAAPDIGPEHGFFLGTDPAEAMRRALRIISAWEAPCFFSNLQAN